MSAANIDNPSNVLLNSPHQLGRTQPSHHYLAQQVVENTLFSMSPKTDSHHIPPRSAIDLPSPSLSLPSLAIDPQLEPSPRASRPDPTIVSAEARDRGRRVASSPQTTSREDRSSDVGFRRRIGEQRFDSGLERDRPESNFGLQGTNKIELPGAAHLLNYTQMPRVESLQMSSSHNRDYNSRYGYSHPSPPPITTLSHSPSESVSSLDQSSTSSPHPSRRPLPRSSLDTAYMDPYYAQDNPSNRHASGSYPHTSPRSAHSHPYSPRPAFDHRYNSTDSMHPSYQVPNAYAPHVTVPSMGTASVPSMRDNQMYMPPQQYNIVHTDDATTKLSDRVRRRCFNCCTTDTSTWRRSNLSPGKVLCNKCGLFERTHSRPRPDQFPHRRGSMSSSSGPVRMRTPPTQLPPITTQTQSLPPPHHYNHPSIAPLAHVPDPSRGANSGALPGVNTWHNSPSTSLVQLPDGVGHHERSSNRSPPSPPLARQQHRHGDPLTSPKLHARRTV